MTPTAVLFDLDGTLIDSLQDVAWALSDAVAAHGLGPYDAPELRPWLGRGSKPLVAAALAAGAVELPDEDALDSLVADFISRYRARPLGRTAPFPGIAGLLSRLEAMQVPLAICTNKPWATTEPVLDGLGWGQRFPVVLCPDHVAAKPAPDMLLEALSRLGAASHGAVMVGDSESDAGAAEAAGLPLAWVGWGYAREPLPNQHRIDTVDELERLLPELAGGAR